MGLKDQIKDAKKACKVMKDPVGTYDEIKRRRQSLRDEVNKRDWEIVGLQQELSEAQDDIERLRRDYLALERNYDQLARELDKARRGQ